MITRVPGKGPPDGRTKARDPYAPAKTASNGSSDSFIKKLGWYSAVAGLNVD